MQRHILVLLLFLSFCPNPLRADHNDSILQAIKEDIRIVKERQKATRAELKEQDRDLRQLTKEMEKVRSTIQKNKEGARNAKQKHKDFTPKEFARTYVSKYAVPTEKTVATVDKKTTAGKEDKKTDATGKKVNVTDKKADISSNKADVTDKKAVSAEEEQKAKKEKENQELLAKIREKASNTRAQKQAEAEKKTETKGETKAEECKKMSEVLFSNDIKSLSFKDGVRTRINMYLGSDDLEGTYQSLKEIINNSTDEAIAGYGDRIEIAVSEKNNEVTVRDYGRGVPFGIREDGENVLVSIYSKSHTGGKFEEGAYKNSSGLNGIGAKCACISSKEFHVWSYRDGKYAHAYFEKGDLISYDEGTSNIKNGTFIRFIPDEEVFKTGEIGYSYDRICKEIHDISYLYSGLTFEITNLDTSKKKTYCAKNGIIDFIKDNNPKPIHSNIMYESVTDGVDKVNNAPVEDGGYRLVVSHSALALGDEDGIVVQRAVDENAENQIWKLAQSEKNPRHYTLQNFKTKNFYCPSKVLLDTVATKDSPCEIRIENASVTKGYFLFADYDSDYLADVLNISKDEGMPLITWVRTGTDNQKIKLEKVTLPEVIPPADTTKDTVRTALFERLLDAPSGFYYDANSRIVHLGAFTEWSLLDVNGVVLRRGSGCEFRMGFIRAGAYFVRYGKRTAKIIVD